MSFNILVLIVVLLEVCYLLFHTHDNSASDGTAYKKTCSCGTCPQNEAEQYWCAKAQFEREIHRQLEYQAGKGPCVIFILDTSASIRGQGFRELKQAFTSIIDEYSHYPDIDENVAVIICGQKTKFQRHYSNRYNDIIHCLDDIECRGLSPLAAGMWLSLGALKNGGGRIKVMATFHVLPRIVLISDGKPTDIRLIDQRDDSTWFETECETHSAKIQLLRIGSRLGRTYPIFCVPVGKHPDLDYLAMLSVGSNGGRIVHIHEVRQFGRYSRNVEIAEAISPYIAMDMPVNKNIVHALLSHKQSEKFHHLEDSDKNDIADFVQRRETFLYQGQHLKDEYGGGGDQRYQELYLHMPPLGSRVKRGPSWKWQNQDKEGIGTVIGHLDDEDGWLSVEWDHGDTSNYRYGKTIYDVIVCNEPRILTDGDLIAAGCRVKRGTDWQWADQDGGPGNIGSVYRVNDDGTVYVRWPNSIRSNYRFGYDGKFDVEICVPTVNEIKSDIEYTTGSSVIESMPRLRRGQANTESTSNVSSPMTPRIALPKRSWIWKNAEGCWMAYPEAVNDIINRNYERNSQSTVLISFEGQRIDMSQSKHVNLTTKEINEISWRWTK